MGFIPGRDFVKIEIDTGLYPLDVIYSVSYIFLDKAYVILDGNPLGKVTVELRPKEDMNLEKLEGDFKNELLSYAFHKSQLEDSGDVRKILLQRALLTYRTPGRDSFEENDLELTNEISGDPEEVVVWEDSEEKLPWEG